jgi:biopolymer transport protein ExbB
LIPGITQIIEVVGDFMEAGGTVLWAICAVTFLMWIMILEREWYFHLVYPKDLERTIDEWNQRADRGSWYAHQIRRRMIAELKEKLDHALLQIKTLVALCPLLGLLGTVTGMIRVFDVMALAGNGNARAMASGVSLATIPTMAGMVAALSGLYFIHQLERFARTEVLYASEHLTTEQDRHGSRRTGQ